MKLKLTTNKCSLAFAAALAASALSTPAQSVLVIGNLTSAPGTGGVFDYTLSLQNTGTEAVQSLWLGWVPGSFNIANPSSPGNNLGWSSTLSGASIQYGGTAGTALAPSQVGTFTFDSTTTPAEFQAQTGQAGHSTAYGVNAANGRLSFSLSPPDTETFALQVVPEPSTFALVATGLGGFLFAIRRNYLRRKI